MSITRRLSTSTRDLDQAIGERIRRARHAAGLSQAELAQRLGLARGAIGNIELAASLPSASHLIVIGRVLRADPAWLLTGSRDAPTEPVAYADPMELRHVAAQMMALVERIRRMIPTDTP